jgi:hypothetical protein
VKFPEYKVSVFREYINSYLNSNPCLVSCFLLMFFFIKLVSNCSDAFYVTVGHEVGR